MMLDGFLAHPLWAVILGLIAGSFTNVLVVRLPRDKSVVLPSSHCPSCKKKLKWWHNIPLISFLLLRGKCFFCRKKISIRYPVIEILVSFLFLATHLKFGPGLALWIRDWPFVVMLVAITFIDLEHRIIPDELSLGGCVFGMVTSFLVPGFGFFPSILGAVTGFSLFYALAWTYEKFAGRSGLGGGDIKLLAMLGAFLGVGGILTVILVSSVLGSIVGLLWAVLSREKNVMKAAIPYGPFLVIGGLTYYLFGDTAWLQYMIPI